MKGLKRITGLVVFAVVLTVASSTSVSAQGILADILKRMDDNNKALKSLKSDLKMSTYNPQINETDTKDGMVQYLPAPTKEKISIRIDWSKPLVEHLAVVNGKYIMYRPHISQAIVGSISDSKGAGNAGGALAFISMNRAQLKANYDVTYIGEATVNGSTKTWQLKLTPKNAGSYREAELWVDSNGMPVQAKVVEKNKNVTTIQLTGVQRNATIPREVFSIKPPGGTKIVQG